ncbi:S41 family peptidase [Flavobacteriales bacterium]|jgi:carboxyl-terminal processing protease|nr:S41 family peptidase [Flavobacteriales bacterium]MDB2361833.1 S41 family peptidase [Flavobacteriales bacterium]
MKKIKKYALILLLSFASIFSVGFVDNYFEISKNLDIFSSLYKELNIYYVDETDSGDLMKTAIDAMLESLDPYTTYIPESEKEDFEFMTTGQYGGIGAVITKKGDWVYVSEPYEGFPADKAGLIAGDKFVEIAGKSVEGKSTEDVSKVLKGEPNTSVKVLIEREGVKKPFEVEITRQEIKLNSVPYYGMVSDSIGYIKTRSFTRNISKEVSDAYNELNLDNQLKGLVLDLRSNPGGLLNEAIKMSNLFIDQGQEIVFTKGKVKEWDKSYKTRSTALDTSMPLVVLINRSSASASEIVSGAIQDLDRGVVLGQRSFGKGLVQQTRKLSYNAQLKVTTAKYYIPSGRCIQALDYSSRDEDGSVGKTPDSLRTEFKTLVNKRTVYDGGGITPDIEIEPHKYSNILRSVISKRHIFNFANSFRSNNDSISSAKTFVVTDAIYDDFKQFLNDKEYEYETKTEKTISSIKKDAEKEKYLEDLEEELEALTLKMEQSKNNDIERFRDEIIEVLEAEIATRYYYQKGKIEATLKHDEELAEAINVLNDLEKYNAILLGDSIE